MQRFIRILTVTVVMQLSAACVWADDFVDTLPAANVSTERLARIDELLKQYIDQNLIGGAVALVLRDGEPVYEKAAGWSDKESGRRMSTDTLFRIASQTKALTSVATLVLIEEGKLLLSDPVAKYIPEFSKTTVAVKDTHGNVEIVPATRQITIKDLLTQSSGMSYGTEPQVAALYAAKGLGPAAGNGWYTADKNEPICDTMARLASLPFVAQPGEAWVYGYNTDVLGCVVERASGQRLDEVFSTRITGPLGMRDTYFYVPPSQRNRLATLYASGPDGRIVRAPNGAKGQGDYVDGPRRSFSGGAGLISTARDYARFLEMLRRDGELDGKRILSPRSVALMRTDQLGGLYPKAGAGFGLGFEVIEKYGALGMAAPGNYGWGGAYGSLYRVDPQSHLVIVLMIQLMPNETDFRDKFQNMVYDAIMDPISF
ncbi:MAG TPA: serine hydrolase domain-containing protein [Povalibacter sp.]|nr:serine hydrolase domain-containing protein [Povalibacter sp.]